MITESNINPNGSSMRHFHTYGTMLNPGDWVYAVVFGGV